MSENIDDRLVAYLDGELETAERRAVEARLDADPAAAARMAALTRSGNLLRRAFDEIVREPVPNRLIAAALGETGAGEKPTPAAKLRSTDARKIKGSRPAPASPFC